MKSFLALFLFISPALAAQSNPPVPEIFSGTIDVKVVNLDVYVTDSQGRPVTGLGAEDFALYEDGKRVEITNFDAIDESVVPATAVDVPGSPGINLAVNAAKPKPLNLVVFVDNYNLRPQTRNRVLKQLNGFLQGFVRDNDQLMVVTHDLGLQIRQPLARRGKSFDELFRKLSRLATRGPLTDSLTRQTLERIQSYGCTSEANVEARSYAQQLYNDTVHTLSVLRNTMESLSGLDGRKAVLYVSDGLPIRPGEDIFLYLSKICGDISGNTFEVDDVASELRKVTTAANAYGVTFYALEAAGLRGFTSVSVEAASSFQTPTMDFVQNANVQDTLFNLASETGGRAVLNANDLKLHLDHIARDFRTYYSLGFSPQRSGSGRVCDLRVELKKPGLKARFRKTYRDSTQEERILAKLNATLLHGMEENPLGVTVDIQDVTPEGKGQVLVPITVKFSPQKLTLLPQGDSFVGKVSILVSSRDEQGRFAPPQRIEVALTPKGGWMHPLKLVTRDEKVVLALAFRDELGGDTTFLQESVPHEKRAQDTPRASSAELALALSQPR